MDRLTILVGRPKKPVAPTKYFFKVPQVGRFIPLVGVIRRPVESPLEHTYQAFSWLSSAAGLYPEVRGYFTGGLGSTNR